VTVDPVLDEVIEGDGQLSVVIAAVVRQLDLDAGQSTMSTEAQCAIGGRFEHPDRAGRKLLAESVSPPVVLAHAAAAPCLAFA
jgi:hypothetical protein